MWKRRNRSVLTLTSVLLVSGLMGCIDSSPGIPGASTSTGTEGSSGSSGASGGSTGSGSGSSGSAGSTTGGPIGAAGGTVSASGVRLEIPAGALSSPQTITIQVSNSSPPDTATALSPLVQFGPDGLQFASPVTVTFDLSSAPSDARIYWSNSAGGYDPLASTIQGGKVTAQISHFSSGFVGTPPVPTQLSSSEYDPVSIAADGTNVYWVNNANNTVRMVSRRGGTILTLGGTTVVPTRIVASGQYAYWICSGSAYVQGVTAWNQSVFNVATGQANQRGIAFNDFDVFWSTFSAASPYGAIYYARMDGGGAPNLIYSGRAYEIGATTSWVLFADDSNVWRIPTTGGTPISMGSGSTSTVMTSNSTGVAWANGAQVFYWDSNLTDPVTYTASGFVEGLALDSHYVYWTVANDGIERAPRGVAGAIVSPLIEGQTGIGPIAADDFAIYWANSNTGYFGVPILSIPKP